MIQNSDMEWATNDYILPRSDIQEITRMSLLALLECSSQALMPDNWQALVNQYAETLTGRTHNISKEQDIKMLLNQNLTPN